MLYSAPTHKLLAYTSLSWRQAKLEAEKRRAEEAEKLRLSKEKKEAEEREKEKERKETEEREKRKRSEEVVAQYKNKSAEKAKPTASTPSTPTADAKGVRKSLHVRASFLKVRARLFVLYCAAASTAAAAQAASCSSDGMCTPAQSSATNSSATTEATPPAAGLQHTRGKVRGSLASSSGGYAGAWLVARKLHSDLDVIIIRIFAVL